MVTWLAGGVLVVIVLGAAFLFSAAIVDCLLGDE